MLLSKAGLTIWTVANVFAAATFMHVASWTWLEPNLRGEDVARGGDAFVWALSTFPVLLAAGVANIVWIGLAERERRGSEKERPFSFFVVVAAIWVSALVVDYLRSLGF